VVAVGDDAFGIRHGDQHAISGVVVFLLGHWLVIAHRSSPEWCVQSFFYLASIYWATST
jgi:hypothetical protein